MTHANQLKVIYSPVFDLIASMFRLNSHDKLKPRENEELLKHYAEIENWVNKTRKLLPDQLKEELDIFFSFESYIGLSIIRRCYLENSYDSFETFITFLEELSPYELYRGFLQTGYIEKDIVDIENQEEVIQFIQNSHFPEVEKWKLTYLYFDLNYTKRRFIMMVRKCWNLYFEDQLEELVQKQKESIEALKLKYQLVEKDDALKAFPYLKQDVASMDDMNIVLAPSVFYGTSSLTSFSETHRMYFYLYGIDEPKLNEQSKVSQDELMENFKILADEKRVKLIKLLSAGPSYGYELASKLNLSNSTISHHLSSLASLGVVKATRKDSRVYYEVNKERLKELMETITASLVD